MTAQEFKVLSNQLAMIAPSIPLQWGSIQNDDTDSKIKMFGCATYNELKIALIDKNQDVKNYFKKRWFLWKCAQCDEYLFYKHNSIQRNPNDKNQDWDIQFFNNETLRFDLKGTVVPKKMRSGTNIDNKEVINFFYNKQSRGIRDNVQNRLFVIHIPFKSENENVLRANFQAKAIIYNNYIKELKGKQNPIFFNYEKKLVDIIYIREHQDNTVDYEFAASSIDKNIVFSYNTV